MRKRLSDGRLAILLIFIMLILDQWLKIWVKTHLALGDSIQITNWFYINFVENNGMAYGMSLGNKLFLSLFRVIAIACIGWYLWKLLKRSHRTSYVLCVALILAGAAGNLFDSMFYGLIFSPSTYFDVANFVPFGEGYAPFLHGKVVDMFYFPLIVSTWPDWIPWMAGRQFVFFSPVFNIADSCITVGVILLFIFFRKELEQIGNVIKAPKEDSLQKKS